MAVISSFSTDLSWIYSMFPPRVPVILIQQPDENGNAKVKNILPNWVMTAPFLRGGRGAMHVKVRRSILDLYNHSCDTQLLIVSVLRVLPGCKRLWVLANLSEPYSCVHSNGKPAALRLARNREYCLAPRLSSDYEPFRQFVAVGEEGRLHRDSHKGVNKTQRCTSFDGRSTRCTYTHSIKNASDVYLASWASSQSAF
jgi:hypothetical protein